jgi:hemoglobin
VKTTTQTFKKIVAQITCTITLLALGSFSAHAQNMTNDDSIYQGLGAQAGITKIVDDFVVIILADERISTFFSKMEKKQFSALLSDQLCELAGGPCKYKGRDMYTTHDGMGIRNAHFNALAEDLQIAMEKNNIASSISNRLVAKLAPMQRPIVSK